MTITKTPGELVAVHEWDLAKSNNPTLKCPHSIAEAHTHDTHCSSPSPCTGTSPQVANSCSQPGGGESQARCCPQPSAVPPCPGKAVDGGVAAAYWETEPSKKFSDFRPVKCWLHSHCPTGVSVPMKPAGLTTREDFFFCSSEKLWTEDSLIYHCLGLAVIKVAIIVSW